MEKPKRSLVENLPIFIGGTATILGIVGFIVECLAMEGRFGDLVQGAHHQVDPLSGMQNGVLYMFSALTVAAMGSIMMNSALRPGSTRGK